MNVASEALEAIASRRAGSLTVLVRTEIERMIVAGDLKAGQRLNEQHLASRFGVSRGPVREALRALERDGLVDAVVNLGTFVRQVGIEEAAEIYDMRALVFGYACAQLAGKASPEQTGALQDLLAEMDQAVAAQDSSDYYRLNLRFHDAILDFAGHRRAGQIYQSLVKESHLLRQRALQPVAAMQESNAEHAAIVAAIVAGDAAAARSAAEDHHVGGKRRWLATLWR